MSGHNPPHGRLGQPNSTWNPLQVPSYIPRQPQLAHMSSERSLARSPLTWHTPGSHQDQLYNLMAASQKNNNLDINASAMMSNAFGRGPAGIPLGGSVDLSLPAAARSTPSPKGSSLATQHQPQHSIPSLHGPGPQQHSSHLHPHAHPHPSPHPHHHHQQQHVSALAQQQNNIPPPGGSSSSSSSSMGSSGMQDQNDHFHQKLMAGHGALQQQQQHMMNL